MQLSDPPLRSLAPARMIHGRVHVSMEAVFPRHRRAPRRRRLLIREADSDDRLDALEAVLPGYDQPERRAVLVWQHAPVEPDGEDRERVQRFVEPQRFDVWPLQPAPTLAGHLLGVEQRDERHIACP